MPAPQVTVYRDRQKLWRWRFTVNGRIMADSGEGYAKQWNAWRAWEHFVRHITRRNYKSALDTLAASASAVLGNGPEREEQP
jgi:uncharacterized protein YegP (UPF0339 family)